MSEQKLLRKKGKALTEGNITLLLSVCADLAEIYISASLYKKAIDEYKEIANIHKEQGNEIDYARANRGIGEAYLGLSDFEKALEHQRIYLDIAKKENNKLELQRAYATLGHIFLTRYLNEADAPQKVYLNSAYKYFTKSLQTCEKLTGVSKFERADMSARIFSNLGIVHESLGEYDKGIELLNKSVAICKANDIYEQLHRTYISLASLHEKAKKYDNSIQNYNFAFEVAKKLKNKISLMCSTLLSKADVLIKLADFSAAKICLHKAYKLDTPIIEDKAMIERNLRIVAALCQTQKKLLSTPDYDYMELKMLYEKMGDGTCDLKNYDKAIEYYHKMLEAVKNCGEDERTLATCYFSLAETYRDNKQFTEAIEYYNKEYKLCKDLKDNLNTLLKIADCTESNAYPVAEVRAVYDMGLRKCREENNTREECRLLSRYVSFLRRSGINTEAFKLEQRLTELGGYVTSDTESDASETQATPTIGDDISLGNITDVSDTSDTEDLSLKRPARRRCKNYIVKRNMKGETPLHTACISGNMTVVRHLLEQGHPVNVRDHCGWLPLHEACINGHLEIVELLLERGAQINDRGGSLCNGVTPLHDAASNGHLDIVELLINKGASVVSKTDDGQTVLEYLKSWRLTADLQSDEQSQYQNLLQKLTRAIEKSGQKVHHFQPSTSLQNNPSHYLHRSPEKRTHKSDEGRSQRTLTSKRSRSDSYSSYRCNNSESESNSNKTSESEGEDVGAADEYRHVMNELRHKSANEGQRKRDSTGNKIPSLLSSEEIVDDWLVDDLGPSTFNKRRKTSDPFTRAPSFSRNNSFEKDSSTASKSTSITSESMNKPPKRSPMKQTESIVNLTSDSLSNNRRRLQDQQISLLDHGFERYSSRSPLKNVNTNSTSADKPKKVHQPKLTHFGHLRQDEPDSTTITRSPMKRYSSDTVEISSTLPSATPMESLISDPMLTVDVRIEGRLYRVPVLMSQMHTRTIKWLAEEAALRYSKKEFMKPVLELESKSGAVLADEDLLSILFTAGSVQAEEVEARVIEWNIPSISERYKEACNQSKSEPLTLLAEKLQGLSIRLDLSNNALRGAVLNPLCKAINRQTSLLELNLSGNYLSIENLRLLALSLQTLKSLTLLNLSYTGMTLEHLQVFVNTLTNADNVAPNLHDINLSYNYLGKDSMTYLSAMSNKLKLKALCLADVDLGPRSFNNLPNVNSGFEDIEDLDLSDNGLGIEATEKVLNSLNPEKLITLNLSRNTTDSKTLEMIVKFLRKTLEPKLSQLNLSRSNCQDSDVFNMLGTAPHLETVNLSYNMELTGISLRRLLSHPSVRLLDLSGCRNILKYFEDCAVLNLNASKNMKALKISVDREENSIEFQSLTKFWRDLHGDKAVIESMPHFLSLSI